MNDTIERRVDDETLSAMIDGALSPEEIARLRARLARDAVLAARLESLQRADARVRNAYAGVVDEPLPARVRDLLDGPDEAAARRGADVVVLKARATPRTAWMPPALAAGIALAIGAWIGLSLGGRSAPPDVAAFVADAGGVAAGTPLYTVFESVPSGATRALGAELAATPRLTFRAGDDAYCRQVDLATARGETQALGCRRGAVWQLEVVAFSGPADTGPLYRPASGAGPLDAAIGVLIEDAPLDAERESALIAAGWEPAE